MARRRVDHLSGLPEDLTWNILMRLDHLEVSRMRFMNRAIRNLTLSPEFVHSHNQNGENSEWIVNHYKTAGNLWLGFIILTRAVDGHVVTFDLADYGIHLGEAEYLDLLGTSGSKLLFHLMPIKSLLVLDLSIGHINVIARPMPPFDITSFMHLHQFNMLPDPEDSLQYIISCAGIMKQHVTHIEYRSHDQAWTQMLHATPVENYLNVNTEDPRSLIFEAGTVHHVSFRLEDPIVVSQDAQHLTQEAFAQEGAFELNEEGDHVMDELVDLWSRGPHGWFVRVETLDDPDPRIGSISLFRLLADGSRVDFISRLQDDLLPNRTYQLRHPLLEVVDGVVHLTFSTHLPGNWGYLLFSYNPTSGWTFRNEQIAEVAIDTSHCLVTSLLMSVPSEKVGLSSPEKVEVSVVDKEEPVPEVIDEVPEEASQVSVDSNTKIEEVPKKSYASIVMNLKQNGVPFSSPAPAPRKPQARNQEKHVNNVSPTISAPEAAASKVDAVEKGILEEEVPISVPVVGNDIPEQVAASEKESQVEVVLSSPEKVEVSVVDEEEPVPEVIDQVQEEASQVSVDSNTKIEEVPKKSYASMVMDLKQNGVPFSSPAPAPRKPQARNQEQHVNNVSTTISAPEVAASNVDAVENGIHKEEVPISVPVVGNDIPEQVAVSEKESQVEVVLSSPEKVEVSVADEEEPVPEVIDEVQEEASQVIVEYNTKIEEVPKKSYASIVMDLKQNGVPFSSPAPALRKPQARNQEQHVNDVSPTISAAEAAASNVDAVEKGIHEEEVPISVPVVGNDIPELVAASEKESQVEVVLSSPEKVEVSVVDEEEPVLEVIDELQQEASQVIVDSNTKIEEVPKKSYASIVMDLKQNGVPFSSPAPALRKPQARNQEQHVNNVSPTISAPEAAASNVDAVENGIHEEEANGYSIYTKGLPMSATPAMLDDEFKKFGSIKPNGIQVRSNRQQGFCFGFVEFEAPDAVQKAIEASPVLIGGRNAVVEEKRSINSKGGRGRFQAGRGAGFRNEGVRGRGNFGGGRGFNRGSESGGGRNDYGGNRGGGRGGAPSTRGGGGDGYQRERVNRGMGVNGTAKNMAPRVTATA